MSRTLTLLAVFVAILIVPKFVLGVECTATPVEDCTISSDLELKPGVYYLNDTNGNGAVQILADNVVLNCNGSYLVGNNTIGSRAILAQSKINLTIKNCNIANYQRAMFLQRVNHSRIYNNTMENSSYILLDMSPVSYNNTIENNTFVNVTGTGWGIDLGIGDRQTTVKGNRFINVTKVGIFSEDNTNGTRIIGNRCEQYVWICIHVKSSEDIDVIGNYIENPISDGVRIDRAWRANVSYNTILDEMADAGYAGIYIVESGGNHTVSYNNVTGGKHSIRILNSTIKWCDIHHNNVSRSYWANIQTYANHTSIHNNIVTNANWNGIQFYSWHNLIYENIIENYLHGGIDTHNNDNYTISGNTSIYNNVIRQTDKAYQSGSSGMYIAKSAENQIYNNILYDLYDPEGTYNRGISIDGSNMSYGNVVFNNTLHNISGYCVYDTGISNLWMNNTYELCQKKVYHSPWDGDYKSVPANSSFIGNTYDDGIGYFTTNTYMNAAYTVNESSSLYHVVNHSGGIIVLYYPGRKDFNVTNGTITVNSLTNAVVYSTNGTVFCGNVTECDGTIFAGVTGKNMTVYINEFEFDERGLVPYSPLTIGSDGNNKVISCSSITGSITPLTSTFTLPVDCRVADYQWEYVCNSDGSVVIGTYTYHCTPYSSITLDFTPTYMPKSSRSNMWSAILAAAILFSLTVLVGSGYLIIKTAEEGDPWTLIISIAGFVGLAIVCFLLIYITGFLMGVIA